MPEQYYKHSDGADLPWYVPTETNWTWYKSTFLRVERRIAERSPLEVREEELLIRALGSSSAPQKILLKDVIEIYHHLRSDTIEICTPLPRKLRSSVGSPWNQPISRVSRDVETLHLSKEVRDVVDDVRAFLGLESSARHSDRGIAFKRNFLFDGAPGTGKTSLAYVFAGLLNRRLYKLNLSDANLADEDLPRLIGDTVANSVILMNDIDQAALKSRPVVDGDPRNGGVSLGGLMDLLDGDFAEGRVMIMTCNKRNELDETLLRPGRIDREVKFSLVTKESGSQMFRRIFPEGTFGSNGNKSLSDVFVEKLPFGTLSPAALETYLLKQDSPADAIANIDAL